MRQHILDELARNILPNLTQIRAKYDATETSSNAERAAYKKGLLLLWRLIHSIAVKNGNSMCSFMPRSTLEARGFADVFDQATANEPENEVPERAPTQPD
jgi:hypothetical protein